MKLTLKYNFIKRDKNGLWFNNMKKVNEVLHRKKTLGIVCGEFVDGPHDNMDTSLARVSHEIKDLRIVDDVIEVDVRILNTLYGKQVKEFINDGIPLFISPKVAGGITEDGQVIVKKIFTFDITYNESFVSIFEDSQTRTLRLRKIKLKQINLL